MAGAGAKRRAWSAGEPVGPSAPAAPSVGRIMGSGFGVVVLLLVLAVAAGLVSLLLVRDAQDQLNRVSPVRLLNTQAGPVIIALSQMGGAGGITVDLYPPTIAAVDQYLTEAEQRSGFDAVLRQDLAAERAAIAAWQRGYGDAVGAGQEPVSTAGGQLAAQMQAANQRVADRLDVLRAAARDRSDLTNLAATVGLASLGALGVGLAIVISARTTGSVRRPLAQVRDVLLALRPGQYEARAPVVGPREIQQVANSVNALADSAQSHEEEENARKQLDAAVRAVVVAVRTTLDVDEVVENAARATGQAMNVDRVFFWPVEEGKTLPLRAEWTADGVASAGQYSQQATEAGTRLDYDQTVVGVDDVESTSGRLPRPLVEFFRRSGTRSAAFVAVFDHENLLGWFCLQSLEPRQWDGKTTGTLATIAREVGVAMVRAGNYEQSRRAVERLTELDHERDAFIHTMTHELRTPLTSIVGYVDMLTDPDEQSLDGAEHAFDEDQLEMLAVVSRNARRLQILVNDLLTLARIESGAQEMAREPITIGSALDGGWDVVRPSAVADHLSLVRDTTADGALVVGDRVQLDRAMVNLLSNAVKFTPEGGRVTLSTEVCGDEVRVWVSDTGVGIPKAEQEKVFSRFFRATNAFQSSIPGTGLGLSLVAAVVNKHDGRMELMSEEGRGTTMVVHLPLAPPGSSPAA